MSGAFAGQRVLVAGATGFLGVGFCGALLGQGARVTAVSGHGGLVGDTGLWAIAEDLTRSTRIVESVRPEALVIAVGYAVGIAAQRAATPQVVTGTLLATTRLLDAAARSGVGRVLLISSTTVYPESDRPMMEAQGDPGWPLAPVYEGVGAMKRYLESLARFHQARQGLPVAILRPGPVYGPWDNFDPVTGHVIPALLSRALARETPLTVWGTGDEVREFVYIDDVVRAGLLALAAAPSGPFNVGSGESVTIAGLAAAVLRAVGRPDTPVVFDPARPVAIPTRRLDSRRIATALGFTPAVRLDEGLVRTVRWIREHEEMPLSAPAGTA